MSTHPATHSAGLEELHSRILARTAKVGIIGLGYVGLPLALLFNEERFPVTGFDVDATKVKSLNSNQSYIYRIPQTEIAAARARGFDATDDYRHIAEMDAIIICVPTPLNEYREPDLSYIRATAEAGIERADRAAERGGRARPLPGEFPERVRRGDQHHAAARRAPAPRHDGADGRI